MTRLEKTRQTIVTVSERLADESDYETKIQPALERARDFLEEQNAALLCAEADLQGAVQLLEGHDHVKPCELTLGEIRSVTR